MGSGSGHWEPVWASLSLGCSFKHYQASYLIHAGKIGLGWGCACGALNGKAKKWEKMLRFMAQASPPSVCHHRPSLRFLQKYVSLIKKGKNMNETEMNCKVWCTRKRGSDWHFHTSSSFVSKAPHSSFFFLCLLIYLRAVSLIFLSFSLCLFCICEKQWTLI